MNIIVRTLRTSSQFTLYASEIRRGSNPAYPGIELSSRGGLERKGTDSLACIFGPTALAADQENSQIVSSLNFTE